MTKLIGLYSNQIDPYFKAEEEFMKSLSEYARKQFLPVSRERGVISITIYNLRILTRITLYMYMHIKVGIN